VEVPFIVGIGVTATPHLYYLLVAVVAAERLLGLVIAQRNAAWSMARGGKELGLDHFPAMVSVHALLLISCLVEVWALGRTFVPWLGLPMIVVVALSTVFRWYCIAVLGKHWNPRLIVIPGAPVIRHGPYRWLRHPDYMAAAVEVAALPLVHSAWLTATVYTVANALVLNVRIRLENAALAYP
jgi:methyltransferase